MDPPAHAHTRMNVSQVPLGAQKGLLRCWRAIKYSRLHAKYREFTMAPASYFWRNLLIVDERRHLGGCVVECGVWRGGMSAGMAEVLGPDREYFLFDSFEGLPPATAIDGAPAIVWQQDTEGASYYDNCRATADFAERAMRLANVPNYKIIKGWFDETLRGFVPPCPIAILRLDGDWYESTMTALEALFKFLAPGGIVIVDDYYAWDGCSRAIHEYLSRHRSTARITQKYGVCVLEPR